MKLSLTARRKIYKLHHEKGASVTSLAADYGVHVATINRIIYHKTKLTKSPRSDKGSSRGLSLPGKNNPEETSLDLLEQQAQFILRDLNLKTTMKIGDRSKILDQCARVIRNISEQRIEKHIKTADAAIIQRIIQRFMPEATEADVIRIFREELERYKAQK